MKKKYFAPFYGYFYVDKYVNWYFRDIDKWFHCKFNRKKVNIFIVLFFIENANSMGIALNTNRNFYISILLTKNVSIYIYWYIYIDMKILKCFLRKLHFFLIFLYEVYIRSIYTKYIILILWENSSFCFIIYLKNKRIIHLPCCFLFSW